MPEFETAVDFLYHLNQMLDEREAIVFDGSNHARVELWVRARGGYVNVVGKSTTDGVIGVLRVFTPEGEREIEIGQRVVKTFDGFVVEW